MSKTFRAEGIVITRTPFGEADRLVTIYTRSRGKVTAIAKGVRRPTSKKKASLEPATQANFFFARGKNLHILTQAQLINSFAHARTNLTQLTQTFQLLEIINLLTVDDQPNTDVYALLLGSLHLLETNGTIKTQLLENIRRILQALGFTYDKQFSELGLKNYIESLAQRQLKTKNFLTTSGQWLQLHYKLIAAMTAFGQRELHLTIKRLA